MCFKPAPLQLFLQHFTITRWHSACISSASFMLLKGLSSPTAKNVEALS